MKISLHSALVALFCVCVPFATNAQQYGVNGTPQSVGVTAATVQGLLNDPTHNSVLNGYQASVPGGSDVLTPVPAGGDQIIFANGKWSRNLGTVANPNLQPILDASALANLPTGSGAYDLGTTGALSQTFTSSGTTAGYIISVANGTVSTSTSADSVGGIALATTSSGPVKVAIVGQAPCYFAGAATQNDIAISNASGQCVDSLVTSSKQLAFGTKVVGKILQNITAAGLANVRVDPVGAIGSGGVPALTSLTNGVLVQSQLPAFAPGSFSAGTDQITNHTWTTYTPFGDSLTAGNGASSTATRYVNLIATKLGLTLTNRGVGSDRSCDMVNHVFQYANPDVNSTNLITEFVGINDSDLPLGAAETNMKSCFGAAASWPAVAASAKTTGASFTSLPTNWTTDTTYAAVTGLQSSTLNAAATWTLPATTQQGQSIIVWYRMIDGNGGQFKAVTSDGGQQTATNYGATPIATVNGATYGVGYLVFPNLARTSGTAFTVTTTVTSATSSSNVVSILGVGLTPSPINANELAASPTVWVSGPGFEVNDINRLQTLSYQNDVQQTMRTLQEAGVPINYVDERKFWHGTFLEMNALTSPGDYKHPNDLGESEIAAGFLAPTSNIGEQSALAASQIPATTVNGQSCSPSTPCTVDPTAFTSTVANGNTAYTLLCSNDAYISTATASEVVTLPSCPAIYKAVYVYNHSPSAGTAMTFTGNTGGNANTLSLAPGQGAMLMQYGSGSWFIMMRGILDGNNNYTFTTVTATAVNTTTLTATSSVSANQFKTATTCALATNNPSCGTATAGFVAIPAGQTTNSIGVNLITANSQIILQYDSSLGTALGVTCNTTPQQISVVSRNVASGFGVSVPTAPTTNPLCFSYSVVN